MKKLLLTAITATAIFICAGCEQFSTTYQRIDESEFRMLDFVYEPADASPGDTVTLMAVFAGKKVNLETNEDVKWWISLKMQRDIIFGEVTFVDSTRLEKYRFDTSFSENTYAVGFKIPIPKDIMKTSPQIPERWTDILPASIAGDIPPEFASMTKSQIIDTLESYLENQSGGGGGGGGADSLFVKNADYLPRLLQIFTVPICVIAKTEVGKLPHTIRSYQTIRYNRRVREALKDWTIPYNHNPRIDSVVVYKVEGKDVQSFDNKSNRKHTTTRLDRSGNAVIAVEDGYTYFLEALTDSSVDYTLTATGVERVEEKHYAYWQFKLDSEEAGGVHHSEYMDISAGMGSGLSRLIPPTNRNIKKFTLWVTVKDEVIGEMNRPEASALEEVSGQFVYR